MKEIGDIIACSPRDTERQEDFVATAGIEFEAMQRRHPAKSAIVRLFVTNAVGSGIAEATQETGGLIRRGRVGV